MKLYNIEYPFFNLITFKFDVCVYIYTHHFIIIVRIFYVPNDSFMNIVKHSHKDSNTLVLN